MEVNLKFHVMLDNDVWSTDIAANLNSNGIDGVIRALDEAMTGNRPATVGGGAHRLWIPPGLVSRCLVLVEPRSG